MAADFQRITPQLLAVVAALLDAQDHESYGWALMQETGLGGPSTYRNLERCEDAGWVSSRWEDSPEPGKPRRRLYRLTPDGAVRARVLLAERRQARTVAARLRPAGGVA